MAQSKAKRRLVTFVVTFHPRQVREPWLLRLLAGKHGLEFIGSGEGDLAYQARRGLKGVEDLRAFAQELREKKGITAVSVKVKGEK